MSIYVFKYHYEELIYIKYIMQYNKVFVLIIAFITSNYAMCSTNNISNNIIKNTNKNLLQNNFQKVNTDVYYWNSNNSITNNNTNSNENISNINSNKKNNIINSSQDNLNNTNPKIQYYINPNCKYLISNSEDNISNSSSNIDNINNNEGNNITNYNQDNVNNINFDQQYPYQQYSNFRVIPNVANQLHNINSGLMLLNNCALKQMYNNNQCFQNIINNQAETNNNIYDLNNFVRNNLSTMKKQIYSSSKNSQHDIHVMYIAMEKLNNVVLQQNNQINELKNTLQAQSRKIDLILKIVKDLNTNNLDNSI